MGADLSSLDCAESRGRDSIVELLTKWTNDQIGAGLAAGLHQLSNVPVVENNSDGGGDTISLD